MKDELVLNTDPKSMISESIRTLRTNIQFSAIDKKIQTILVTSSMPGEGKSFIASNLALAFAQAGNKTLLVDCDIRKGRQHYIFGLHNQKGLSNLLLEDLKKKIQIYIQDDVVKNLSLLCRGTTPPNPSELLSSEKNKTLIEMLKKEYDVVIFDSAPLNGLPDSLVMSTLVDGTIIVSACKETEISLLNQSKKSLEGVDANILGVVLNKTDKRANKYYGSYYG